jgi:uncharacterized UBP type Zn finger protein
VVKSQLIDLGQSCWLNSVLQAFSATKFLASLVDFNFSGNRLAFVASLVTVLVDLQKATSPSRENLIALFKNLKFCAPNKQQDAMDGLTTIFCRASEELMCVNINVIKFTLAAPRR